MLNVLLAASLALSLGHARNPDEYKADLQYRDKYWLAGIQAVASTDDEAYLYAGPKYTVNIGQTYIMPYAGIGVYYEENIRNYWRTNKHFTVRYIFGIEAGIKINSYSIGAGINTITNLSDRRFKHAFDNYGAGPTGYISIGKKF